jgi:uncharacterized alkaline shock family protein YloU
MTTANPQTARQELASSDTADPGREVAVKDRGDVAVDDRKDTGRLTTGHGRTSIADSVVQKIAGIATREVAGVHDLGTGSKRAVGTFRQRIPGSSGPNVAQGVSVEVGERQAAIDLDLVCDYGVSIVDLSHAVRRNVITSVEGMTGLEVTEVNIAVDDVFVESYDEAGSERGRVQ